MTELRDYPPEELPAHGELADDDDELGWDRDLHGLMVDAATDDEPETVPYNANDDPFLRS